MKSLLQNAVSETRAGKFLIRKCAESDIWAWSVTGVGIGLIILICAL